MLSCCTLQLLAVPIYLSIYLFSIAFTKLQYSWAQNCFFLNLGVKYSCGLENSKKQIEVCWNGLVACAVLLAILLCAGNGELNLNQDLNGEITLSANFDSKGKTTKGR